jgi:hypothetical protein
MISYIIKKDRLINKVIVDNEKMNNEKGIMLRVSNGNIKEFYFISDVNLYNDVLFFGKNKVKTRIKTILESLSLKVIPDTFKNNKTVFSYDLIHLNLTKFINYRGLF